jgi:hypothetical protein
MEKEISGYNIDKRRYEIQGKKVPVWHAGIYRPISSTASHQ